MKTHPYRKLGAMTALSFLSMYVLMYAMVDKAANALPNLNQLYMAGLMTAPMVVIELLLMKAMYGNRRLNAAILGGSVVALVACLAAIRDQTAVGDEQFLRSMIPHHAAAILMCDEAPIEDAEIVALCENIVRSQQAEIQQMRERLAELGDD